MKKFKVVIIGAGSGGISVAARLNSVLPNGSIAIIDSSEKHYYQPLWTLSGAGLVPKEKTERDQADLIPKGVEWLKASVSKIDPAAQSVSLAGGEEVSYEYLIVATGLKLDWEKIEGLKENLGKNGIVSIYQYDQVDHVAKALHQMKGGTALFVMPPPPIKCAGAPQKIMYLAENIFRNRGVRQNIAIKFATAGKAMFGIPTFANALEKIVDEKDIEPLYSHKLVAVDANKKEAIFDVTNASGAVQRQAIKFDLLHVVPPMSAHSLITEAKLAFEEGDQKGWLAVDKHSLQHLKYKNIFGIGDVTGVPNSKTGAAVRAQAPIVVQNLLSVMNGEEPKAVYNGYSSCPLVTEIGKVMLAEFGYDGKLLPTFPLDPSIPRRSYWHLKKSFLPKMYWHGMLKGRA